MPKHVTPIREKLKRYIVADSGCWEWAGVKDRDGYGVSFQHVSLITHRKSWRHL